MTLQRAAHTGITLKGVRQAGGIVRVGGGTAAQQEFKVRIAPTELLASVWSVKAPVRGDVLIIGGRARSVLDAQPISDGDVTAMYELTVAG